MNRIDTKFNELEKQKKKAFIAYICAGDSDIAATKKLVLGLVRSGVDILELGIPFSDPLAVEPSKDSVDVRGDGPYTYLVSKE